MSIAEAILASGFVGWKIAVPVLRVISSVLFALAVSKDCKSRNNGSAPLWGLTVLISPLLFGIIYFVYSRFLRDKSQEDCRNKKGERQSKILCIAAVFVYAVMAVVLIATIVVSISSAAAVMMSEDYQNILTERYYDMYGTEYETAEEVPVYDEAGNVYKIAESENGFNYYTYFDQNGNEYDIEKCYISQDGYFYYDAEDKLQDTDELYYYDKHFYDENGNIYAHIDDCAFFDKNGRICIVYRGNKIRYAFDKE